MARRLVQTEGTLVTRTAWVRDDSRPIVGSWQSVDPATVVEPAMRHDPTPGAPVPFARDFMLWRDEAGLLVRDYPRVGEFRAGVDGLIAECVADPSGSGNPYDPATTRGWARTDRPASVAPGVEQWERNRDYVTGQMVEAHGLLWTALQNRRSHRRDDDDRLGTLDLSLWSMVVI